MVYRGGEIILDNDDWSASSAAASTAVVASQVGAFTLPSSSKDAALLVTLPAGAYTVQVSGVASGTGVALVETYELP